MIPVIFNDANEINVNIKKNGSNIIVTYTEIFTGDYTKRKSRFDVTVSMLKIALKQIPNTVNAELIEAQCDKEKTKYVIKLSGKPEYVIVGVINELLLFLINSIKRNTEVSK